MSLGHPNQACARCPTLAHLGALTPQNDRTEWGINLVYQTWCEIHYLKLHRHVVLWVPTCIPTSFAAARVVKTVLPAFRKFTLASLPTQHPCRPFAQVEPNGPFLHPQAGLEALAGVRAP